MRNAFTINQRNIIENGFDIDVIDACLIEYLSMFSLSNSIIKISEEGKDYFFFSHNKIAQDCPMLKLKKDSIYRRLKNLCDLGFLEQYPNSKQVKMTMYALTEKIQLIYSSKIASTSDENPKLGTDENPMYSNTIYNNSNVALSETKVSDYNPLLIDIVVLKDTPTEIKITKAFFDLIKHNQKESGVTTFTSYDKTKLKSWLIHIERLINLDGVTITDLQNIYTWLSKTNIKNSDFWKKNILSTKKLREKFPQLQTAMQEDVRQAVQQAEKENQKRDTSRLGL